MAQMSSLEKAKKKAKNMRQQQKGKVKKQIKGTFTDESSYLNMKYDFEHGHLPASKFQEFEALGKKIEEQKRLDKEERMKAAAEEQMIPAAITRAHKARTSYEGLTLDEIAQQKKDRRKARRLARKARRLEATTPLIEEVN